MHEDKRREGKERKEEREREFAYFPSAFKTAQSGLKSLLAMPVESLRKRPPESWP